MAHTSRVVDVSRCTVDALEWVIGGESECMERSSMVGARFPMPIYVAHAKQFKKRRQHIASQLAIVGAAQVVFVLCADADVVAAMNYNVYECLHPEYTRTSWSPHDRTRLPNGTLSLAIKHRLAHFDIWRLRHPSALVIEDDAVLPAALPSQLEAYLTALPMDASLFYVGSYSRSTNPRLTLADLPALPNISPSIHLRLNGTAWAKPPHILDTVAYVVLAKGAAALGWQPIRAEADVDLSLLGPSSQCTSSPADCYVAAPDFQYGPAQWLAWQDATVGKEVTHGKSKDSVRDGWMRACRAARPSDIKGGLLRACRRFGFRVQDGDEN